MSDPKLKYPIEALREMNRKTYRNIDALYTDITTCINNNPQCFKRGSATHNVFQFMQQRGWIQRGVGTTLTVVLKNRTAPRDISELNDVDVIPPRDPTY